MSEILHGRAKSHDPDKHCECKNDLWIVSETSDGKLWWLCVACGRRYPVGTLQGKFPEIMKPFDPPG